MTNDKKQSTGRPRSLDASRRSLITTLVALGNSLEQAAKTAGCAPCTLRREVLRDPHFKNQLASARDGAPVEFLQTLIEASRKYPAAALWLRKHLLNHFGPPSPNPESQTDPTSGLPGAQNCPPFCAPQTTLVPDFSDLLAGHQRAKRQEATTSRLCAARAKPARLAPADYMSPAEFVQREQAKQRLARIRLTKKRKSSHPKKSK